MYDVFSWSDFPHTPSVYSIRSMLNKKPQTGTQGRNENNLIRATKHHVKQHFIMFKTACADPEIQHLSIGREQEVSPNLSECQSLKWPIIENAIFVDSWNVSAVAIGALPRYACFCAPRIILLSRIVSLQDWLPNLHAFQADVDSKRTLFCAAVVPRQSYFPHSMFRNMCCSEDDCSRG